MTTTDSTIHPFERAGLGRAPYRLTGVTKNIFQAGVGAPMQPGSSCDFCATAITYEYWIVSSDGRRHKVGCDCIYKIAQSGDKQLVAAVNVERKRINREVRAARVEAQREARRASRRERAAAQAAEFVNGREVLEKLLAGDFDANATMASISGQLRQWGALSAAQVELVERLAAELTRNDGLTDREKVAADFEARKQPAPEGRVEFEGVIVGKKVYPAMHYGDHGCIKIMVECDTFKVWMTAPAALDNLERGTKVRAKATLSRWTDKPEIASGKRPTLVGQKGV